MHRFVGIVTVGRSDFGIYGSLLQLLRSESDPGYGLYVGGAHLARDFGNTLAEIEATDHPIVDIVSTVAEDDSEAAMADSMTRGISGFFTAFGRRRPDLILLLGDRYEMLAAALAGTMHGIPMAHIHGGEVSEGAMDNAFRHSITKLSHLHFVSTALSARRVELMGEDPERIFVTGAPALDNVLTMPRLTRGELADGFGIPRDGAYLLATFHPATLEPGSARVQIRALIEALEDAGLPVVFTSANADPGGRAINAEIRKCAAATAGVTLVESFGLIPYFSAMSHASAMVGNSSSGIIEAASFRLPVVNVGSRQAGRERSANILDSECSRESIRAKIGTALSADFRAGLKDLVNIYGDGNAAPRIMSVLKSAVLNGTLLKKRFHVASFEGRRR